MAISKPITSDIKHDGFLFLELKNICIINNVNVIFDVNSFSKVSSMFTFYRKQQNNTVLATCHFVFILSQYMNIGIRH